MAATTEILAAVLRQIAAECDDARSELPDSDDRSIERASRRLRDSGELVRVLARLVEGKDLHAAFGAPGDWGYSTKLGQALYQHYSQKVG